MRAMRINSTPWYAAGARCQEEFFVTIFCGRARRESLPTFRVARFIRRAFACGKAVHRAP
jgi:hypothetical protein